MNTKGVEAAVLLIVAEVITIAAAAAAVEPHLAAGQVTGQITGSQVDISQAQVGGVLAQTAQPADTGCRQANSTTGIYAQPSLDSASRGILASAQTVRLELLGSGTGWARITEPAVGWVEAKYLSPATACTGLSTAAPTNFPAAQAATQTTQATRTVTIVCEVLPSEGLVVRSQPTIAANTALHTLPKGSHQFAFTNNHLTTQLGEQERYWSYITAPYTGWISLGVVGKEPNLGGRECG